MGLKHDWRSFSSDEFRACVRTVDNEDAVGTIAVEDGVVIWDCGWSCDNRSAKETSDASVAVPLSLAVGASVPMETIAVDSL